MRSLVKCVPAIAILALLATRAESQILGRLQKKAQEAVEKKAEDKLNAKIDQLAQKMVDNSFSAVFGDSAASAPGGAANGGSSGRAAPFSLGGNAKTESQYKFDIVTSMEIETWRRDGASAGKALLKMHFNTAQPYTGTAIIDPNGKAPEGQPFIVLDAKNESMVMFMASDKNKFSIAYDWKDAQRVAQANAQQAAPVNWDTVTVWRNYRKIGTKTIAGFSAEGYRSESPDGTAEVWISRDKRLGAGDMFAAGSSMKQLKGKMPNEMPYGMLLEMSSSNAGTGEKVSMKVTEINTSANVTYAMSDYPKMELGRK
jgi:hypothetical protein